MQFIVDWFIRNSFAISCFSLFTLPWLLIIIVFFNISGHSLTGFLRHSAESFLSSEYREVRLEAVRTCSYLLNPLLKVSEWQYLNTKCFVQSFCIFRNSLIIFFAVHFNKSWSKTIVLYLKISKGFLQYAVYFPSWLPNSSRPLIKLFSYASFYAQMFWFSDTNFRIFLLQSVGRTTGSQTALTTVSDVLNKIIVVGITDPGKGIDSWVFFSYQL